MINHSNIIQIRLVFPFLILMETSKIELVNFFENRDEMIQYCINLARTKSIKFNILNSGNYYKIQCKDQDCPFQITFNLRDSKKCKMALLFLMMKMKYFKFNKYFFFLT